ncbi:hypothetical protein MW335_001502 [Acinetobacter baumannii]|uniref:DUF6953 family protein n=1 Tax=Acinetobacter baumannii TaxID=470 RepID=UPI003891C245|nr:hypothetical protein [Acinetobacter baumannii]
MTQTNQSVAQWLYNEIMEKGYVYQGSAVYEISKKFGDTFVYTNKNGNLAISEKVLGEFKKLKNNISEGSIEWDRSERAWRYKQ